MKEAYFLKHGRSQIIGHGQVPPLTKAKTKKNYLPIELPANQENSEIEILCEGLVENIEPI